jgi:hypothetical protein
MRRLSVSHWRVQCRAVVFAVLCAVTTGTLAASSLSAAVAAPSLPSVSSVSSAVPATAPTTGAANVRDFGALGTGTGDETAAFAAAMAAANQAGRVRYANGPSGAAQGVVYVPAGTYRLLNLTFPNNMRMEVDAAALLEQAGGRGATSPPGYSSPGPSLILWDGLPGAPLRNVSLTGVGSATGGAKSVADPVTPGWSIANSFTFNLDPQATNANNLVAGVMAMNVDGFLITNVFSIQNDFQPTVSPTTNAGWWPSSRKAALELRARSDSPVDKSQFYDPHNGTIANWYNVHSPRGYGPNQVNSAHNISLSHIFTQGGSALRIETDNSNQVKFGSEVRSVLADDVAAVNCNRAVAFAPHFQTNIDVHVSHVQASSCYQGVVEAIDEGIPADRRGSFINSTISNVTVLGGTHAQDPNLDQKGLWSSGASFQAFGRESQDSWAVTYSASTVSCNGMFLWPSDALKTTVGVVQPACAVAIANPKVPSAPPMGIATVRLAQATVSFSPALDDGGSPVTGYTVTSSPGRIAVTGTTSPLVVPHLQSGTTYVFTVHATNAVGSGAESSPSNAVIATGIPPPDAPTGLVVTVVSSTRVQLNWNKAARATGYLVLRANAASGPFYLVGSPAKPRFTDSGLTPNTTYYYLVQASSATGNSPACGPAPVTTAR